MQRTLQVLATPVRGVRQTAIDTTHDEKDKKAAPTAKKKSKRDKFEKLEALSQRLRLCILKRVNHRRHCSS